MANPFLLYKTGYFKPAHGVASLVHVFVGEESLCGRRPDNSTEIAFTEVELEVTCHICKIGMRRRPKKLDKVSFIYGKPGGLPKKGE